MPETKGTGVFDPPPEKLFRLVPKPGLKTSDAYLIDWGHRRVVERIAVASERADGDCLVCKVVAAVNMPANVVKFTNIGEGAPSKGPSNV